MLNQGVNRTYGVPKQYEKFGFNEARLEWVLHSPTPVILILDQELVKPILDATKTTLSGALTW